MAKPIPILTRHCDYTCSLATPHWYTSPYLAFKNGNYPKDIVLRKCSCIEPVPRYSTCSACHKEFNVYECYCKENEKRHEEFKQRHPFVSPCWGDGTPMYKNL